MLLRTSSAAMAMEQPPFTVTDLSKSVSRYSTHMYNAAYMTVTLIPSPCISVQLLVLAALSYRKSITAPCLCCELVECMILAVL